MGLNRLPGELPDFLPLFLEFLSLLSEDRGAGAAGRAGRKFFDPWRTGLSHAKAPMPRCSQALAATGERAGRPTSRHRAPKTPTISRRWTRRGRRRRCISAPANRSKLRNRPAADPASRGHPGRRDCLRRETDEQLSEQRALSAGIRMCVCTVFVAWQPCCASTRRNTRGAPGQASYCGRRQLVWGSNLFHVGILVVFAGHIVGLLTPVAIFDALGISHTFKQLLAMSVGGVAGIACFVGTTMLVHRRLFDPRIRNNFECR